MSGHCKACNVLLEVREGAFDTVTQQHGDLCSRCKGVSDAVAEDTYTEPDWLDTTSTDKGY